MHGWNPLEYLSITDPIEEVVARKVLQAAEDLAHERRRADVKAMEVAVQNGIARAFR